jgi:hypothetical protein
MQSHESAIRRSDAPVVVKRDAASDAQRGRQTCLAGVKLPAKSDTDRWPTTRGLGVPLGGSQPSPSELDDSRERPATYSALTRRHYEP